MGIGSGNTTTSSSTRSRIFLLPKRIFHCSRGYSVAPLSRHKEIECMCGTHNYIYPTWSKALLKKKKKYPIVRAASPPMQIAPILISPKATFRARLSARRAARRCESPRYIVYCIYKPSSINLSLTAITKTYKMQNGHSILAPRSIFAYTLWKFYSLWPHLYVLSH